MSKTGDLKQDTVDLQIVVTSTSTSNGIVYKAVDQYGNVETARTSERVETYLRAKHDIQP